MDNKKYKNENDVDLVIPNLWLGNEKAATNLKFLIKYNIKTIITVMDDFKNLYDLLNLYTANGITLMNIPIKDKTLSASKDNILFTVFDSTCNFIKSQLALNKNVLIHCKRGHHRSAAIVAAYLIKELGINYKQAVVYIHKLRPFALAKRKNMSIELFKYNLHVLKIKKTSIQCGVKNGIFLCN